MTSWRLFPPWTREGQFDEKWAFVGKKEKRCDPDDPADAARGDSWDHVAFDPEHRLVLWVVPGKRSAENVKAVVAEFQRRTDDAAIILLTSDEYPAYKEAIHNAYGQEVIPPPTGKPGRPRKPYILEPEDINFAVVHKTRKNGRVVSVSYRIVFGTEARIARALEASTVSQKINTAFLERENGTDRHRNARKARKSYCFSKDGNVHDAVTYFTIYSYNFCWPVRTLRLKDAQGNYHDRTPAMAAGLTDHVWSLREWLTFPAIQ